MKTNQNDKATARPWRIRTAKIVKGRNGSRSYGAIGVVNKKGNNIARIWTSQSDASLIVSAVNSYEAHQALVALVQRGLLIAANQRQLNARLDMPTHETQWEIDAKEALSALDKLRA